MRSIICAGIVLIVGLAAMPAGAAFASSPDSRPVWIVSNTPPLTTDGAPHPLQGIRAPDISPDGTGIIFSADGDLWTVDIDPKNLTPGKPPKGKHFTRDELIDFDPVWSPDGKQIAFVSDRGGKPEIWLHDRKTNKERQLTTLVESVEAPSWSPDSNRIAFYKVPSAGDPAVRSLSIVTAFTGDVRDIRANIRAESPPAWSRDGETLALKVGTADPSQGQAAAKFMLVSLTQAPDRFVVPDTGLSPVLRRGDGPAWSPDGTKLAYVDKGILHVVPVTPKGVHVGEIVGPSRVLTDEAADSPRWSPDSQSVVFVADDRLKRLSLNGELTDLQPSLTWNPNIPEGRTVVWAGRLWDGSGAGYQENVDIVIDGNVITAVAPHRPWDARTRVVNASHKTVIPGLIESRAHLAASVGERLGRMWLAFGVTSVRDWGTDTYDALERRESWSSGRRPGPREFFVHVLMGESASASEIARAQHLGYDIAVNQPPSGLDSKGIVVGLTEKADPALTAIPDLAVMGGFAAKIARTPALLAGPQMDALYTDDEQAALKLGAVQTAADLSAAESLVGAALGKLHALAARGGHILLGSGAPEVPYGLGFLVECQLAQQSGLTPLQVMRMVTVDAAAAVGLEKQLGTVEAGKLADLAIIDGDPLKNVADLINVGGVIANGHYYIIDELVRQ